MSANNQTLIKEHNGKWLVFENVNAESWCMCEDFSKLCTCTNKIKASRAYGSYDTRDEAINAALDIEHNDDTEYGIHFNRLCKDGAGVEIIEEV